MTEPSGGDGLERALRELFERVDPVPPSADVAARSAYSWRETELRGETGEIEFDSLLQDEATSAQVRGGDGPRLLRFASPARTIEIEVSRRRSGLSLTGQLIPPEEARVTIEHRSNSGAPAVARVDVLGRFELDDVLAGDVRLTIDLHHGAQLRTRWTRL